MSHARERFRHVLSQPTSTVAANLFDPVCGRSEKIHPFLMFFIFATALRGGEMTAVPGRLGLVKNGWIIAAVEGNVGFDEEMVGKQPAAIAEQELEDAAGIIASAQGNGPGLEDGGEAEAGAGQQQ